MPVVIRLVGDIILVRLVVTMEFSNLRINHLYYILLFVLYICCNADMLLFANCELLVNLVLICFFFLIFNVFFVYNFKDIFFIYPSLVKKDLLLSQSILLYYYKRFILYTYKYRINFVEFINKVCITMFQFSISSIQYIYILCVLSIHAYIESRLFLMILSIVPVLKNVVSQLAILFFCYSIVDITIRKIGRALFASYEIIIDDAKRCFNS